MQSASRFHSAFPFPIDPYIGFREISCVEVSGTNVTGACGKIHLVQSEVPHKRPCEFVGLM